MRCGNGPSLKYIGRHSAHWEKNIATTLLKRNFDDNSFINLSWYVGKKYEI